MAYRAAVLGASGYSGGELLRLLAAHPGIELTAAGAHRKVGVPVSTVHPNLAGAEIELIPNQTAAAEQADVLFSCLPSGALSELLDRVTASVVIDLADDHRSDAAWVYGLTEFARDKLGGAPRIANPGCYPTAVLLALVPLARAGVIEGPIVVDALSGVSGAGSREEDSLLFARIEGTGSAYGTIPHRHVGEMERYLVGYGDMKAEISFTPHLIPVARGLLATVRARTVGSTDDSGALGILREAYEDEPFIHVVDDWPTTKSVTGSNGACVFARVDPRTGWVIASAAIDNLGKGAAGQALQNANVALGLDEGTGLVSHGVWP